MSKLDQTVSFTQSKVKLQPYLTNKFAIYLQVKSYRWHSDAKTSLEYSSTAKSDSVERQLLIRALPLTGCDARAAHECMTEDLASLRAVDVDQR